MSQNYGKIWFYMNFCITSFCETTVQTDYFLLLDFLFLVFFCTHNWNLCSRAWERNRRLLCWFRPDSSLMTIGRENGSLDMWDETLHVSEWIRCCEADMTSDSQVCSAAVCDFKKITFEVSFQAKQGWYAHVKQTLRLNCRIHWKQIVKQNTLCQLLWFMYFTQYLITGFGLLLRQSNEHRSTSCSSRVVVFQAGPVSSLLFSVT